MRSRSRSRGEAAPKISIEDLQGRFPHCRASYPVWVAYLLAVLMLAVLAYAYTRYPLRGEVEALLAPLALGIVWLWRHDSNKTLRERLPPQGWKSEIEPSKLVNLSPKEFDGMRFELSGDEDDDIEDHKILWAGRYSRDVFLWIRTLVVLGLLAPLGAVFLSHMVIPGGAGELPQTYDLVLFWLLLSPLCLLTAGVLRLDWDYGRLMVDQDYLYELKENPAWLPWIPGKNNPIRMSSVWSADPIDNGWGKRWGHGTVVLTVVTGYNRDTITLERIPRHRDFCNAVNGMITESGRSPGGMMY
jgi:hypothetical protein